MAESTSLPSLPSTADATPYVPVSWAAAAAAVVSVAFLATLLVLGVFAFTNKKPLLMEELLVMPAIALVLCFAARRMVRNSEGTRTEMLYGMNLINTAWWIALVLGLCYIAYLFAFDFAIRRDARGEVAKWMDLVNAGTPTETRRAFHRTLPPGARQGVSPDDEYKMEKQFRDELLSFRNCDLLKLAQRNKGEMQFAPGAVTWSYKPGTVECVLQGAVTCPEGTFPIVVPLKGVEGVTTAEGGGGGRQWQVTRPPGGGFVDQAKATRTAYGWLLVLLEMDGGSFGRAFVGHLASGPPGQTFAYRAFVAPGGDLAGWGSVALDPFWQLAFAAPARAAFGDAEYAKHLDQDFYKLPGGAEPPPDKKRDFLASWRAQGVRPAGDRLKDPGGNVLDKEDAITLTDSAIEVRVPIEIPLLGKVEVARGRVVVVCTDPALVAELKQLKASANPAQGMAVPPVDIQNKRATWRVVRIESDMAPVSLAPPGPGGPGGPGGPPG